MALRTRSTSARAAIAASRIKQSETERLQSAIKDMENAITKYNNDKNKRSNKRGLWGALGKLGSIVTKAGAYVGNPLVAGAGLAVSGVSGYAEGSLSKKQSEKAEDIRTDFTDPLSNLLFVGQTAKDVQRGAENLKSTEEQATDEQYASDLFRIGSGLAMQTVTAGQAGTFDSVVGGTSDFLNKPLLDLGEAPGDNADPMTKFLYNQRKSATPSVGQLLGGVSPAQQQMGQSFMQGIEDRASANIAEANQQGFDALSNIGSGQAPDLGFDMIETPTEIPSFDSLSPGISTSNVFPNFTSIIPTETQPIAPLNLNQKPIDRFDLIQNLIGRGQSIPSGININTRPSNVQDAFAGLTSTINRYNQGGM